VRRLDLDPPPGGSPRPAAATGSGGSGGSTGTPAAAGAAGTAPFSNRRFCEHLLAQYAKFSRWLESPDSFVRADALVILCTRAAKMQDAYIKRLGEEFKKEGGFKERLGEARREERARQEGAPTETPPCPECGGAMRLMRRKRDNSPFWGCGGYPGCRGTLPFKVLAQTECL